MRRRVLTVLSAAVAIGLVGAVPAQAADTRISGANRFETAALVSAAFDGSEFAPVYLATGENFPDALAASAAAGADQSRVLLTSRYSVPQATWDELQGLGTRSVYVIGGTTSVSAEVETELERRGYSVLRLEGANRYGTAVQTARILFDDPDTAFLATGQNFPDALAGAAAAGSLGAPILLVGRDTVPAEVRDAFTEQFLPLRPSRFFVLGGEGAISPAVIDQIRALGFQNASFERLGGNTRYATAVAVGQRFFPGNDTAVLAVGDNYPDALAAGPFAAEIDAPLLLTQVGSTPVETAVELERRRPDNVVFVGAARP
ncbi:cell wall-binding repeat-containing protein [Kineococcus gynurae]|uniref:Cell wall-binding repeat-containing protein n=1 Tax=Kineococcus gynurae TaxID=452979 RepID=A0ABV5LQ54_9ACTN